MEVDAFTATAHISSTEKEHSHVNTLSLIFKSSISRQLEIQQLIDPSPIKTNKKNHLPQMQIKHTHTSVDN
jgi:hypothetical protein